MVRGRLWLERRRRQAGPHGVVYRPDVFGSRPEHPERLRQVSAPLDDISHELRHVAGVTHVRRHGGHVAVEGVDCPLGLRGKLAARAPEPEERGYQPHLRQDGPSSLRTHRPGRDTQSSSESRETAIKVFEC